MAKSKQDYFDAGAHAFVTNKRAPAQICNPCKEGSWQFMAWQDGYLTEKLKDDNLRIAADIENEAHARSLETVGRREPEGETHAETLVRVDAQLKVEIAEHQKANQEVKTLGKGTVPRIAIKHIQQLQTIAATSSDPKRAARCARKVQALVEKWGRRSHA